MRSAGPSLDGWGGWADGSQWSLWGARLCRRCSTLLTVGLTVGTPTYSVEVITLPVSDVEQALRFYVDQVGFTVDVDYSPNDAFWGRTAYAARLQMLDSDR